MQEYPEKFKTELESMYEILWNANSSYFLGRSGMCSGPYAAHGSQVVYN
jgi:hypothetical protein